MAGMQKVCLNNLNLNLNNALIVGIIIAKSTPRTIESKKKNGESRGVMSFTLRDSDVDTINVDVWGSEYFVITIYERFIVGDVVEVSSPKIFVKKADNELFKPQVSSPFYLSLNEGQAEVQTHQGEDFCNYFPLLHIPTKPSSGYCGIAEILKLPETSSDVYVDLLVVVKSVKPVKAIKTKTGKDMKVRTVEIMDNTAPSALDMELYDTDTIQRAEEWRPLDSVLFVADAVLVRARGGVRVRSRARTVFTHQPHTADAEALRLHTREHHNKGGEAAAWAAWSGERTPAASVAQIRDRLDNGMQFCVSLHALLTHLDLDEIVDTTKDMDDLRVRFADHNGEITARIPINVLADSLGCSVNQLKLMSSDERAAIRWRLLLEQCNAKLAASPRLIVLSLRRASSVDPIPLY